MPEPEEDMTTNTTHRHVTAREGFPQDVLDELEAAVDAFLRIAGHNPD